VARRVTGVNILEMEPIDRMVYASGMRTVEEILGGRR
jgi:hypothetical protein